eukprot:204062_1
MASSDNENEWRYSKNNKVEGPTSFSNIVNMYRSGELDDRCQVWNGEDISQWTYIKNVPVFAIQISKFPPIKKQISNVEEDNTFCVNLGKHSGVIQIINNLRAVGAQIEVDLPAIVLCGQQSCGKSSLTEAICGVPMPRNAGTCTRCPTELRLIQREGNFKCDIGIRYEYDDINQKPLNSIQEQHVGSTNDRLQVASIVTRAQKDILEQAQLQFSRNVITVTIYDPHCLNLTILDLPGLIFAI